MPVHRFARPFVSVCIAVASFASIGAAPASAQDSAPEALVKAAQAEGGFTLYSSSNEGHTKGLLAAFEKKYGIQGTYLRLAQTPLEQRFATEFDANRNQADVFSVSSPVPYETHPEWFEPLSAKTVPSLADWPARWQSKNYVTWQTNVIVLYYNTDQFAQTPIRTWSEVADPRWKGKILLTDPRVADNYMGWLDGMERRFGMDFLRKIAAQDSKLTQSGASGVQMVAAGAYPINFPSFPDFSTQLIAKKAPLAIEYISDPMFVSMRGIGIVSKAPHPNTARLFLNWLLSPEGIRTACSIGNVSVAADPDGKLGCSPVRDPELVNYTLTEERQQELLRAIGLGSR